MGSMVRLRQFQLRRLAILGHLGCLYFLLRRELVQLGDSPCRLLMRHLEFLAPGVESVREALVSTPLPLAHRVTAEAGPHIALVLPEYQSLLIHFLKSDLFAPI